MIRRTLFNFLFGFLLLIFTPALLKEFYVLAGEFFKHISWHPITIGTVMGFYIERYFNRHFPEVAIFEHEITHAIVGLPFGFIPTRIWVSRNRGGTCRHIFYPIGLLKNLYPLAWRIVTLAPYFLPTFTVILALFLPMIPAPWKLWYDIIIGATFGFHALSGLVELKENYTNRNIVSLGTGELTKSDIGKTGMFFSPLFIIVAALSVHSLVLALIVYGYQGIGIWFKGLLWYTDSFTLPAIAALLH